MAWTGQAWSPRRRAWIMITLIALTFTYTWHSVSRLRDLVGVEEAGPGRQTLLERAESNVISHLHLPLRTWDKNGAPREDGANLVKAAPAVTLRAPPSSSPPLAVAKENGAQATSKAPMEQCSLVREGTDMWGEVLVWGQDNIKRSAAECCEQCLAYTPNAKTEMVGCNVWVFCADRAKCGAEYGQCWLKHLAHPEGTKPSAEGPEVGWASGVLPPRWEPEDTVEDSSDDRTFHTVITAQGSAVHWQSRIGHYWFLKTRKACRAAGRCDMGGFTRVLHSGERDDLMDEIPTYVAQPLPPEHPDHGYVVLNRPYALMQWVRDVTIPEKYVLMSEPDHIWLRPMPNLMIGQHPAAFPFFYIEPSKKENLPIVTKFVGAVSKVEAEKIAPIGNAPTMLSLDTMKAVMPIWFNMSIAVHNDPVASREWGWVQEMYAFTLSCFKAGVRRVDLHIDMMSQPPWDTKLEPYYILHYTYGMDYSQEGEFMPGKVGEWRFDKRSYGSLPPPRGLGEPPPGMKNELVRHLIYAINEASSVIPGWDDYAKTGVAKELWDGVV